MSGMLNPVIFVILYVLNTQPQFTNGQYMQCDANRLQRCQQDVLSYTQDNNPSGYTGITSGWQPSDPQARCNVVRQTLDCLITMTPVCQGRSTLSSGLSATDVINRARQFLERSCDSGGGWKQSTCYQRSDIRQCESNLGQPSQIASSSTCQTYQRFRTCAINIVRQSCLTQDLQLMASYLIDKVGELSWSCPITSEYGSMGRGDTIYDNNYNNQYGNNRQPGQYGNNQYGNQYGTGTGGSSYNNQWGYGTQQPGQYGNNQYGQQGQGGTYGSYGGYGPNRYDQYGNQGQGQYGSQGQYGQQGQDIDRLYPGADTCIERAGYFTRSCEDTLVQRQRDAREGRSSYDVQRRICCALFFYRDCISRIVVDRCREASPAVVDILMGSRRRDLTVNCREVSRDQCNSSTNTKASIALLISFIMFWLVVNK